MPPPAKSKASWNTSASIETTLSGSSLFCLASSTIQMDRGLSVDHRVVLLDGALNDALVSLVVPVDVDLHSQKVINSQRALDDLERSLHSATSQEQSVHGAERRLRRGETLPLRQWLRPHDG